MVTSIHVYQTTPSTKRSSNAHGKVCVHQTVNDYVPFLLSQPFSDWTKTKKSGSTVSARTTTVSDR